MLTMNKYPNLDECVIRARRAMVDVLGWVGEERFACYVKHQELAKGQVSHM